MLLHGFTQTGACWEPLSTMLRRHSRVLCPDMAGHGEAGSLHLGMWESADHLAETTSAEHVRAGVPPVLVGYSLGGRLALHAALCHPEHVGAMVLIGATPGIDDPAERARRRESDEELAERIRSGGVSAFLDEWLAMPMFAGVPPENSHRAERETNTATGLAASLRLAGAGAQSSLWGRLGEIRCRVLAITGANDAKFSAIAERMIPLLGGPAEHVTVTDTGHAAHLERPEQTAELIESWLSGRS